jgi:hypothetical protein
MHRTPQQPARPIRQQVPDVHQDGGRGVRFRAWRDDGHGRPGLAVAAEDLEARLAAQAEEEGEGAVVGVGACADVGVVGGGGGFVGARRVAQEAQDCARGAAGAVVCGGEEGWGVDLGGGVSWRKWEGRIE